jgi:hypothetical protein
MESLSSLLPSGEDLLAYVPSNEAGPLDRAIRRDSREAVERGIAGLPSHFRIPLVLKELMELSISEVAEVLGLKMATVKTRVHRGRLLLRRELATTLPKKRFPPPDHPQSVCLTLIEAKQVSLDQGTKFPVPPQELCERCRTLFDTLELTGAVCHQLGQDHLPEKLRRALLREFSNIA